MKSEKKSRPGQTGEPLMMRIQPDLLAKIDKWRRKQNDPPSRQDAIRTLVESALTEGEKKSPNA